MAEKRTIPIDTVIERYAITSAYMNCQTPEQWELLKARVAPELHDLVEAAKAADKLLIAICEGYVDIKNDTRVDRVRDDLLAAIKKAGA